jgi:glycosyltransferase 2 family protein
VSADAPRRSTPGFGRRVLFGVAFGVVVYGAIVMWRGVDSIVETLRGFPYALIPAALALSFGNYALRFLKWERYRRLLGIDMPVGTSWLIYLSGFSMGVTPGKMGEVLKSWLIRRVAGTPIHASAPIVVAERFTDLLSFLILVAVAGIASRPDLQGVFWSLLALCAAALALASSGRFAWFVGRAVARTPYFWRLAGRVDGSFRSMRVLLAPREVIWPTLLSSVSWGLECVGFWLLARGVAGDVAFDFAVFAYAFSAVAGAVLFIFPGGLGPTEGALGKLLTDELRVGLAGRLGAELAHETARNQAAAIVLLARLCTLWFGVLVGFVALMIFQRRYGRIEGDPEIDGDGDGATE